LVSRNKEELSEDVDFILCHSITLPPSESTHKCLQQQGMSMVNR